MKPTSLLSYLFVFGLILGLISSAPGLAFASDEDEVLDQTNLEIQLETQETEDLGAANETAEQDLFKSYSDIKTAEGKLRELHRKNTRLASQIDAKVLRVQKNRQKAADVSFEAQRVEKQSQRLEAKVEKLNQNLADLETAKTKARERVKLAQEKVNDLKSKTREVTREMARNERQFQSFKKQQKALALAKQKQAIRYQAQLKKQRAQKAAMRKAGFKAKSVATGFSQTKIQ